jgi:hypothetical protein
MSEACALYARGMTSELRFFDHISSTDSRPACCSEGSFACVSAFIIGAGRSRPMLDFVLTSLDLIALANAT